VKSYQQKPNLSHKKEATKGIGRPAGNNGPMTKSIRADTHSNSWGKELKILVAAMLKLWVPNEV